MTITAVKKSIARFDPVSSHPVDESERHYSAVHFPFAQRLLYDMPQVVSYHTNRVLRQYDLCGGWNQRPTAWRFVLLVFDAGRGLEFTREINELITQDHLNCLKSLRSCGVEETTVLDRLSGQTTLGKYLIEFDRAPSVGAVEADARLGAITEGLLEHFRDAFGTRLIRSNRVSVEGEAEAVREPGQRSTGRVLPETDKHAYLEIYVDDTNWGDDVFARSDVRALLREPCFSTLAVYHVEERCGIDRRQLAGEG